MSGRHHDFIFIEYFYPDCLKGPRQFQSKAIELCKQVEKRIAQPRGDSTLTMCICPPILALGVEADKQTSTPK